PELFLLHIGLILRSQCPAILPWPTTRIDRAKYQRNLVHQIRTLAADALITVPDLAANLSQSLSYPVLACDPGGVDTAQKTFRSDFDVADYQKDDEPFPCRPLNDALFLQFSGGTTGAQKAVAITASMLVEQLDRLREVLSFSTTDCVASWLPLYHDMGLIGCLWLPLWAGGSSTQLSATDWLMSPELLFKVIDKHNGTFCWLPNFAFSYLAQQRRFMKGKYVLGGMRAWINCSEPVRLASMEAFVSAFSDWGVRSESMQASYAMAENVFAVTQSALNRPPATFPRERLQMFGGRFADASYKSNDQVFVSSGKLLPDMHLRIVDSDGDECGDGHAGEIQISTPSLFGGYWSLDSKPADCFTNDGWYRTGDLGFVDNQDLYVIGRIKDIIIVGGQNIFPEDVESIVNKINGVYPGRVVAFGVNDEALGTEAMSIVAEHRESADQASIEAEIRKQIMIATGVAPRYVKVVPERWIIKSTAGKISRRDTKERFIQEFLK